MRRADLRHVEQWAACTVPKSGTDLTRVCDLCGEPPAEHDSSCAKVPVLLLLDEVHRLRDKLRQVVRRTGEDRVPQADRGHRCSWREWAESAHDTAEAALSDE